MLDLDANQQEVHLADDNILHMISGNHAYHTAPHHITPYRMYRAPSLPTRGTSAHQETEEEPRDHHQGGAHEHPEEAHVVIENRYCESVIESRYCERVCVDRARRFAGLIVPRQS